MMALYSSLSAAQQMFVVKQLTGLLGVQNERVDAALSKANPRFDLIAGTPVFHSLRCVADFVATLAQLTDDLNNM